MNVIKKLWVLLLAAPVMALAATGEVLDKAPVNLNDKVSMQRGAKMFTSTCLGCHSAAYMRYNRLKDIGMSTDEIKALLPAGGKLGSTMQGTMDAAAGKAAFGVAPPDLSVTARSRGADWLYTYFHSFYKDPAKTSGVNNVIFPGVAMPNVLGAMQGEQELRVENHAGHEVKKLVLVTPGSMSPAEYDATVADLVNYMVFMSEPAKLVRYNIGYYVLGFLFILLILTYALKKEYWKDIH